ncbi:MAG: hypothetical protein GX810_01585, partial [Clostridiales bacterium]|nr:hypothetical protein [Clostridiales bacterium]
RMNKAGYTLDEDAREPLRQLILDESENALGFGNARGVRNLFEQTISRQASRMAKMQDVTREQLMQITRSDIPGAEDAALDEGDDQGGNDAAIPE